MKIYASRFWTGMLQWTKLMLPDRMEVTDREVLLTRYAWAGLSRDQHSVRLQNVASVHLQEGLLKAAVYVETFGGARDDMHLGWLSKRKARRFKDEIDKASDELHQQVNR